MAKCKEFDDGLFNRIYVYDIDDIVSLDMVKSIKCDIGFQNGPKYIDCNIDICRRIGNDKFILHIKVFNHLNCLNSVTKFVCLGIDDYLNSVEVFAKRILCYAMDKQYDEIESFQVNKYEFR